MVAARTISIIVLSFGLFAGSTSGQATLINNGPDGEKLVFAVLGDGYAAADLQKYHDDVDRLVVHGVFEHDFYRDNQRAFNVYRMDLTSTESGVSTPEGKKDTALKTVFTGTWDTQWIRETPVETDRLINAAVARLGRKVNYVFVVLNESGWGGVQRGDRMYVTSGIDWAVVAHEYGHGIGGLADEYTGADVDTPAAYSGECVNSLNVSTVLDRDKVVWKALIKPETPVPTDCSAPGFNCNTTVGMFKGASYADTKIYRPVENCRMRTNTPAFCPVCRAIMDEAVRDYLGPEQAAAPAGASNERPAPPPAADAPPANAPPANAPPGNAPPGNAPPGTAKPADSYVMMVLHMSQDGTTEVVSAEEFQGRLVQKSRATSPFIAALTDRGVPAVVQPLPQDPFIVRGFTDEANRKGEKVERAKQATVIVHIPRERIAGIAPERLGVAVYKVDAGVPEERISPAMVKRLKDENKLTSYLVSKPNTVGPQLDQKIKAAREVRDRENPK